MADDKRNREQPQSDQADRQRGGSKDRKPGGMESPGSGQARREDEEESQE